MKFVQGSFGKDDDGNDEIVNDIEKYEFAFIISLFDYSNSFRIQNMPELPRN